MERNPHLSKEDQCILYSSDEGKVVYYPLRYYFINYYNRICLFQGGTVFWSLIFGSENFY
jgi:hypothetical protein